MLYCGVVLRPVPLFPYPLAKVTGALALALNSVNAQYQLVVLIVIIANFIMASIACYFVICVYLLNNEWIRAK